MQSNKKKSSQKSQYRVNEDGTRAANRKPRELAGSQFDRNSLKRRRKWLKANKKQVLKEFGDREEPEGLDEIEKPVAPVFE